MIDSCSIFLRVAGEYIALLQSSQVTITMPLPKVIGLRNCCSQILHFIILGGFKYISFPSFGSYKPVSVLLSVLATLFCIPRIMPLDHSLPGCPSGRLPFRESCLLLRRASNLLAALSHLVLLASSGAITSSRGCKSLKSFRNSMISYSAWSMFLALLGVMVSITSSPSRNAQYVA